MAKFPKNSPQMQYLKALCLALIWLALPAAAFETPAKAAYVLDDGIKLELRVLFTSRARW